MKKRISIVLASTLVDAVINMATLTSGLSNKWQAAIIIIGELVLLLIAISQLYDGEKEANVLKAEIIELKNRDTNAEYLTQRKSAESHLQYIITQKWHEDEVYESGLYKKYFQPNGISAFGIVPPQTELEEYHNLKLKNRKKVAYEQLKTKYPMIKEDDLQLLVGEYESQLAYDKLPDNFSV